MNQYDQFKDKLHDYKVEIDKEKLWEQTAHAIPQRKRRRMILFLLAGTIGMASLWLVYSNYRAGMQTPFAAGDIQVANQFVHEGPAQTDEAILTAAEAEPVKTDKPQKTNPTLQAVGKVNELHDRHTPSSRTRLAANAHSQVDQAVSADDGTKQITSSSTMELQAANPVVVDVVSIAEGVAKTKREDAGKTPDEYANEISDLFKSSTSVNQPMEVEDVSTKEATDGSIVREINPATVPLPGSELPVKLLSNESSETIVPVMPANRIRKPVSFSLLAAAGISSFSIRPLNDESTAAAALLEQHVRSLEHLSVDLTASLPLANNLSVETSVGWNRWTTETKQQTTVYTPFEREGVTSIRIDEYGVSHPVNGLVQGTHISHKQLTRFTRYYTTDVSLGMRQSLWRKNRFHVDAMAEGSLVLFDQASGSTLDREGVMWKFTPKENPFALKSRISAGASLQLNYNINPHLSVSSSFEYHPVNYQLQQGEQQTEWKHSEFRGHLGMKYQY